MCHGACPPVLKNIQLLYKECSITVTSVSISASDKERRLRVYISIVSQSTIHTHTRAKAQTLTARARRCSGDRLHECPITIAYHCHHPIHRLCACRFSAGLDRCAPPHPPSAIRLSQNAYFSLHTITCTRHWVCFDFSPSGLIKRRGKKRKNREKCRFEAFLFIAGKGTKAKRKFAKLIDFFSV